MVEEDDTTPGVRAPAVWLQFLEQRVLFEIGAMAAASPYLRCLGRGDRHPVLVLPGFTAGDSSTVPLRWSLRGWGYWAHGWSLGSNMGPTASLITRLRERLELLYERHGCKVSIIGWSLGGMYARELARLHPEQVRMVITLGSPFRMVQGDRSAASWLADLVMPEFDTETTVLLRIAEREHTKPPVPVPTTAIYTRSDGVVRWHTCIDTVDATHENIEVRGSHSGLGFNPAVLYAVADRLIQLEDDWRPFVPPLFLRQCYPRPASWESVHPGRRTA
jgi:pimeloyl-ACP methyl ester carboxylesterase